MGPGPFWGLGKSKNPGIPFENPGNLSKIPGNILKSSGEVIVPKPEEERTAKEDKGEADAKEKLQQEVAARKAEDERTAEAVWQAEFSPLLARSSRAHHIVIEILL